MKPSDFAKCLTSFLAEYLPIQRNLSQNTIKSYSDTFRLLLLYCKEQRGMRIDRITLAQLDKKLIEDFITWLREHRSNSASTVNQRLAVIRAFFDYVCMEDPRFMLHYHNILTIPFRRVSKPCVSHLTTQALQSILSCPNIERPQGRRDLVLLAVLYDTGARVQEIVDLTLRDLHLDAPASITLHGKGRKTRIVPIMRQTVVLLQNYLKEKRLDPVIHCNESLFQNRRRQKLTRAGVSYILSKYANMAREERPDIPERVTPHVLRHTKAMHLVQADVNLIYIRDILGHADVRTTEVYAKADSDAKRQALEKAAQAIQLPERTPWTEDADMMDWLKSLSSQS